MSEFDIIVVSSLVITYIPAFWFLGMNVTAQSIAEEFGYDKTYVRWLIPKWASKCGGFAIAIHYCFVLLTLFLMNWVYGLAAFGAGVIPFILFPSMAKMYRGIFRRGAFRAYKIDPASGKFLLEMLMKTRKFR
ncbi:Uncharacterised protein [Serratia fonticola]|uniref:hypothetical protein n=1 Tax=Serratia fonticola TaxID=47917 RepID=UPI00217B5016|nr:hypothetical protein [Serratia fonticola]CAI1875288.1 Uncharacterised protein [Serratia fonticola]